MPAHQVVAPGDADAGLAVVGALAAAAGSGAVEGQQVADGRIAAQVQDVTGGDAALRPRPLPQAESVEALVVQFTKSVERLMPMPLAGEWISTYSSSASSTHAVVLFPVGLGVGGPVLQVAAEGELHACSSSESGGMGVPPPRPWARPSSTPPCL